MVILHGSDFQVGKPYRPLAGQAFIDLAGARKPDLVVISGDLTQRAKASEYRVIRSVMDELAPIPVVVTPGNHDVPLYRLWERLLAPYLNWRRFIGGELDTVTRVPGATVVALNSSAPRRAVVGGRVDGRQVAFARAAFRDVAPGDARILVVHHHFVPTADGEGGRPLPGAGKLLRAFEGLEVDVILGGHVHQTHLRTSRDLIPGDGAGIPIVTCGTTASSRGRGPEADRNTLNVIRLTPDAVEVVSHEFEADRGAFVPGPTWVFPRGSVSARAGSTGGDGR